MFSKFNEEVQKVLLCAKKEMNLLKHSYIGTEHLVLSILKRDNIITKKLNERNVFYSNYKDEVIKNIGVGEKDNNWYVYTPLLKRIIENSILINKEKNSKEVMLDSLFLSLLEEGEGVAIRTFISMGIDIDDLYDEINQSKKSSKHKSKLLIDEFGIDLNKAAANNELDPVIGRDKEVHRVIEILCRRVKNNALLIGDAGVGKTAIVEELSRRIVNGEVPLKLINKRVVSLSMASLVSGTKYRGEFEERVTKLLKEVEDANDVIVFIDEIHTLVGAGGAEGAIDASNILKPSLARGKVNIIGATTTIEYKKTIEDDKALSRRFQTVTIEEPNEESVTEILVKLKPIYEEFHNVLIENDILKLIVKLSNKYLYNRKQPDKAIDILDEVCARASILEDNLSKKNQYYKRLLKSTSDLKNDAILNNNFNKATYYREEELKLESKINKLDVKLMNKNSKKVITSNIVREVMELKSRIPVYELSNKKDAIDNLFCCLENRVIGQNEAIKILCNVTKKMFIGLKNNKKPISLLFAGPTGCGKTYLAKEYNNIMFGSKNLIYIDMSEFKEEHSISKIIGSPPGYVGYQSKTSILEEIKDNPHSVILVDEVEKAHPSALNLFLQILDEGRIKDSCGNVFRFDNNVIIMTANCGLSNKKIGFSKDDSSNTMSDLKKKLSLELINRIDDVVIFNCLSCEDIKKIIINKLESLIKTLNIEYEYTEQDVESIISQIDYEVYGARKIENAVVNILNDFVLSKS